MKMTLEELEKQLKMKNLHLSHQRLKVFEYLVTIKNHPTADEIYRELQKDMATLSKTTIYNTLKLLVENGLVKPLAIEDYETRYDIIVENHGHFKCEICGEIYNFHFDIDVLKSSDLSNFIVKEKNVYFKGICPRCLSSINETTKRR